MSKLKFGFVSAIILAGLGTLVVSQQQTNTKLRSEIENLRMQTTELDRLRAENERLTKLDADGELSRLRNEHKELMRLRGQASSFAQHERELTQAQKEIQRLQTSGKGGAAAGVQGSAIPGSSEGLKPRAEWNNVGFASPESAFETWNWAKRTGDIKTLANSIVLDSEAKPKAEALLASLPESVRGQYGSAEEMMASLEARTTPIAGMRVISQNEQPGSGEMVLHAQWQFEDGRTRENDLRFVRSEDGAWRSVIPAGLVDKLGGMLIQSGAQPAAAK